MRRGFTLIELIVAVAITALMLVLIGQIFDQTRQAIGRGTATGDVIANSQNLATTLARDTDGMLGPNIGESASAFETTGGFLMVVHDRVLGVTLDAPNNRFIRRPVRSDQIVFVRERAKDEQPIAPTGTGTFSVEPDDDRARHVLVWYGHAKRTNPDGTIELIGGVPATLGQGSDERGQRWILGRQATFLGEDPASGAAPPPFAVYVNGISRTAPIPAYAGTPAQLRFTAGSDYAYFSLDQAGHTNGRIVGNGAGILDATLAGPYATNAIDTFAMRGAERLRVNPEPDSTLESWRVAQMHPYLAEYVSDFAIDYAIDYNLDGRVDSIQDVTGAAAYAVSDGGANPQTFTFSGNATAWFTLPQFANASTTAFVPSEPLLFPLPAAHPSLVDTDPADNYGATVFRHDDESNGSVGKITNNATQTSYWPYMLRIRWKLHDARGQLASGNVGGWATDGIDNDRDGQVDESEPDDAEVDNGVWFERVIRVPRPNL